MQKVANFLQYDVIFTKPVSTVPKLGCPSQSALTIYDFHCQNCECRVMSAFPPQGKIGKSESYRNNNGSVHSTAFRDRWRSDELVKLIRWRAVMPCSVTLSDSLSFQQFSPRSASTSSPHCSTCIVKLLNVNVKLWHAPRKESTHVQTQEI